MTDPVIIQSGTGVQGPSGPAGAAGNPAYLTAKVVVPSAAVLTSGDTPVQIIAGIPGKLILPLQTTYNVGGTIDYANSAHWGIFYASQLDYADYISAQQNASIQHGVLYYSGTPASPSDTAMGDDPGDLIGQPIVFGTDNANPTAGNGDITVTVVYIVVTP